MNGVGCAFYRLIDVDNLMSFLIINIKDHKHQQIQWQKRGRNKNLANR